MEILNGKAISMAFFFIAVTFFHVSHVLTSFLTYQKKVYLPKFLVLPCYLFSQDDSITQATGRASENFSDYNPFSAMEMVSSAAACVTCVWSRGAVTERCRFFLCSPSPLPGQTHGHDHPHVGSGVLAAGHPADVSGAEPAGERGTGVGEFNVPGCSSTSHRV